MSKELPPSPLLSTFSSNTMGGLGPNAPNLGPSLILQSQKQQLPGRDFVSRLPGAETLSLQAWDKEELAVWVIYFVCVAFLLGALLSSSGGRDSADEGGDEDQASLRIKSPSKSKPGKQYQSGTTGSIPLLNASGGLVQMNPKGRKRAEDEARALREARRKKQEQEFRFRGVLNFRRIGARFWRRTEELASEAEPRSKLPQVRKIPTMVRASGTEDGRACVSGRSSGIELSGAGCSCSCSAA